MDPTLTEAYNFRGTVYSRLGQVRRAVEDFGEAIRLDPAFEAAYANRALAHALLGEEVEKSSAPCLPAPRLVETRACSATGSDTRMP